MSTKKQREEWRQKYHYLVIALKEEDGEKFRRIQNHLSAEVGVHLTYAQILTIIYKRAGLDEI